MSTSHYHNIQSSLLRFLSDFKDEAAIDGDLLGTVNLDAHTDEDQWPAGDFVGLGEFQVDIEETYSGQAMIAIATHNDTNLHRMGRLMQKLSGYLLPGKTIPAYDAQTGDQIGLIFILKGTRIGAPLPTKVQPIQPAAIRFDTDLTSV